MLIIQGLERQPNLQAARRKFFPRESYSPQDFEWDQLQRLAQSGIQKANVALMQQHAQESFTKRMLAESAEGSEGSN
jgi:hypothetical protein